MNKHHITSVKIPRELRLTNYAHTAIITNHDRVRVYQLTRSSQRRVKMMALRDELEKQYKSFRIVTL